MNLLPSLACTVMVVLFLLSFASSWAWMTSDQYIASLSVRNNCDSSMSCSSNDASRDKKLRPSIVFVLTQFKKT